MNNYCIPFKANNQIGYIPFESENVSYPQLRAILNKVIGKKSYFEVSSQQIDEEVYCFLVDEEGLLKGLPISYINRDKQICLVGNSIVLKRKDDDLISLNEKECMRVIAEIVRGDI